MGYEISLSRAWDELEELSTSSTLSTPPEYTVSLLDDVYVVQMSRRVILSEQSCGPAKEEVSVLILHYLIGTIKHSFSPQGKWISFRDLWGGNSFLPAFQESVIRPLIETLREGPDGLVKRMVERFKGQTVEGGDVSVELATFPGVCVRIIMWMGDDELPPEAAMIFDKSLAEILSTEDIAVLLLIVSQSVIF